MPRGGKREGAGRKKQAPLTSGLKPQERARPLAARQAASAAQRVIEPWLPGLLDSAKRLADGIWYEDPKGRVYQMPPSVKAIEYLVDRLAGKPTERHEDVTPETFTDFFQAYNNRLDALLDGIKDDDKADYIRSQLNEWLDENTPS